MEATQRRPEQPPQSVPHFHFTIPLIQPPVASQLRPLLQPSGLTQITTGAPASSKQNLLVSSFFFELSLWNKEPCLFPVRLATQQLSLGSVRIEITLDTFCIETLQTVKKKKKKSCRTEALNKQGHLVLCLSRLRGEEGEEISGLLCNETLFLLRVVVGRGSAHIQYMQ